MPIRPSQTSLALLIAGLLSLALLAFNSRNTATATSTALYTPTPPLKSSPANKMSRTIIVSPTAKHTASIIFSHGLGDSAQGWAPFAQALKGAFPHVKWILPTAPLSPVTLNGGYKMNSWFDLKSLDKPLIGGPTDEDEAGMLASVRTISQLVSDEIDAGIPSNRIVVGGFSQGSAISLLTGLTSERKLAGLVLLSGWLGLSSKTHMMETEHAKKLPIFWGHGTDDQVVRFAWGKASVEKLQSMGYKDIEFKAYPGMEHSLCPEEQRDVATFLAKVLPPTDA